MRPPYKRILLKLSGEAFLRVDAIERGQEFGIKYEAVKRVVAIVKELHDLGVQIGIVVGGGNIFRGLQAHELGFPRSPADFIGMLGTVINGLFIQQAFATIGCETHVMSAFEMPFMTEKYNWQRALGYLQEGAVVIFVGGTGNPYFTTDTAAALRASEINAEILLKATKVNGIYDKDPLKYPGAKKFRQLTYADVLNKNLNVMDLTAISLCRENQIPICILNIFEKGSLLSAVCHGEEGSLVMGE